MSKWASPRKRLLLFLLLFVAISFVHYRYIYKPRKSKSSDLRRVPGPFVHPKCGCWKSNYSSYIDLRVRSTCPSAQFRGPNQHVISYSFFGNTSNGYFKGLSVNAETVSRLYDNWTVRVYHNITDADGWKDLCREVCRFQNLDECSIGDLGEGVEGVHPTLWRFLVMGDPSVRVFGVRDLDSPVYQREVDAVNDWLMTNKTFHIMRDHKSHAAFILAGMWGAWNMDMVRMRKLRKQVFDSAVIDRSKYVDQYVLYRVVWPAAEFDHVAHDSYTCMHFNSSRPWPTQRVNGTFVGDMYGCSTVAKCPEECRPKEHPEWEYC